jgi:3D (Asp-Asp-Asp) domain-containing protein
MGSENDLGSTDALITLRDDLYNWNVKNNSMFNGSFTVKGSNRFKVGHRLKYNDMEYYITRVVHNFVNFGSWTTELGVIRGMKPAERFKVPYGAGTEYTGLGMVPYNPAEARRAMQASKYLVSPISGSYLTKAQDVVAGAQYLMEQGTVRYVFGADNVGAGKLDCSSFTQYIYKTYAGMAIGRTTGNQVTKGVEVKKADLMAGDLVFFKNTYNSPHVYGVSHVGIYIGNGQFIHNSSGSGGIVVANLSSNYWVEHWLMGRRVLQPSTAAGQYTMTATAYGATVLNGGAGTGLTASGTVPREGYTVAVDPNVIPLGTQLRIECSSYPQINGVYTAEDTGGAIKAKRIDIYFDDLNVDPNIARQRMYQFGKREVKITILN